MAFANALFSYTIQDEDGDKQSVALYIKYSDTDTFATLAGELHRYGLLIDAIIEGKIVSNSMTVYPALDVGYSTTVAAGADVEETGLFNFQLNDPPSKSYSIDIPAFRQELAVGNIIDPAQEDVAAFIAGVTVNGTTSVLNDLWSSTLPSFRHGKKRFRK